jgi:hypothetical protein
MLLTWEKVITGQAVHLAPSYQPSHHYLYKNYPSLTPETVIAIPSYDLHLEMVRPLMRQAHTIITTFAGTQEGYTLSFGVYCENDTHALYCGLYLDKDLQAEETPSLPIYCLRQVHLEQPVIPTEQSIAPDQLLPVNLHSTITFVNPVHTPTVQQLLVDAQAHLMGGVTLEYMTDPHDWHNGRAFETAPPHEWEEIQLDFYGFPFDFNLSYSPVYVGDVRLEAWLANWQERFTDCLNKSDSVSPEGNCKLYYRTRDKANIPDLLQQVHALYPTPDRERRKHTRSKRRRYKEVHAL